MKKSLIEYRPAPRKDAGNCRNCVSNKITVQKSFDGVVRSIVRQCELTGEAVDNSHTCSQFIDRELALCGS